MCNASQNDCTAGMDYVMSHTHSYSGCNKGDDKGKGYGPSRKKRGKTMKRYSKEDENMESEKMKTLNEFMKYTRKTIK